MLTIADILGAIDAAKRSGRNVFEGLQTNTAQTAKDLAKGATRGTLSLPGYMLDFLPYAVPGGNLGGEGLDFGGASERVLNRTPLRTDSLAGDIGSQWLVPPIEKGPQALMLLKGLLAGTKAIKGGTALMAGPVGKALKTASETRAAEGVGAGATPAAEAAVGPSEASGVGAKTVAAPKQVNLPATIQSGSRAGIYRGSEAFGGMTADDVDRMRQQYLYHVQRGAPYRLWYDDTSKDLLRLAGKDPERADNLATMLATTSSGTDVGSNTGFGFKGYNQRLVGDPVNTGRFPTMMSQSINEALANPEATASGLKRSAFNAGLAVDWRGEDFANRATHDIRDVRAYGIVDPATGKPWSKGVGDAGHRFLDEQAAWVANHAQSNKLGGFDDWNKYRAQAAAWISQKAEEEGISLEEAAKHYGDYIKRYTGQVTRSWVPGSNTGHLTGLLTMPEATQTAFSNAIEPAVRGYGNTDKIAHALGGLADTTLPNAGIYEGVVEPGFASQIPIGRRTGSSQIDPSSAAFLDATAATHGMLGAQKQVAWSHVGEEIPQKRAGAIRITDAGGQPFTIEQLRRLQPEMAQHAGAFVTQVDPFGAQALINPGTITRKQAEAIRSVLETQGYTPSYREFSGNLFPEDPTKFSVKPYIAKIKAAGPQVEANFNANIGPIAEDVGTRVTGQSQQLGLTQAPWYPKMIEALKSGGLPALEKLVQAGIVPVAVLALFGYGQMQGQDQQPPAY